MIDIEIPSDTFADFGTVIRAALDRGLTIHPVKPRGKEPWLKNWPAQASKDPLVIAEWARRFPTSNYGVVATEEFCILESDDYATLRDRLSHELPTTYEVSARPNRPHMYYRQTEVSKAAGNMDCPGVFEFKQNNRYVVGEGSVHPTGAVYRCLLAAPIAPMPDWLVKDLQAIRSGRDTKVSAPVPPAGAMLGEGEGRHPMLMSQAAKLWDGEKTREEMFEDLEAINQQHCDPPKTASHLLDIIDWVMEREPSGHAGPKVVMGSVWGVSATDLAERDVPVRSPLMVQTANGKDEVLFYESSINQILAWRGVGKTNLALGLAGCFASGSGLLDYRAVKPSKVLYLDGELPLFQLRERASQFCRFPSVQLVNPESITPPESINLLAPRHWDKLVQSIEFHKPDVLFLDSLSTLTHVRGNEDEDQIALQTKLNILRNRYHLCVITLHHTGKTGLQRGLSRNDDILDVQMKLNKVDGWEPGDGLKFELVFDKIRHSAALEGGFIVTIDKEGRWKKSVSDVQEQVRDCLEKGFSLGKTAKELDIDKSRVKRIKDKLVLAGIIELNEKHKETN